MVAEISLIDGQQPRDRRDDAVDAVVPSRGSTPAPVTRTPAEPIPLSSRGTPTADDLESHDGEPGASPHADPDDDGSLDAQADDGRLLGLVADTIGRHEDSAAVLATVLEMVSVRKDIAYCAFVEPEGDGLVIRHEYAAFAGGGPTGAVLRASGKVVGEILGDAPEPREWFLAPEALSIAGGGLVPSSVMMLASPPGGGPRLLLVAADRCRTPAQLPPLLPLLRQIVGMARLRLENLRLVRLVADLSAELEKRGRERSADLDQADGHLRVEVAERERAEHGLRLATIAVETIAEGVMITDPQLCILAVNRAFSEITGYDAAEAIGQQPSLLQSGRHDEAFYAAMWASIRDGGLWQGEIWNRRKNGTIYPGLLSISVVRDSLGEATNYIGVFSDSSTIKADEARFEFLANHDPLTGLPNRLLFVARGERALAAARFSGGRVAVMFLDFDLDRFKHLSKPLDHGAGDDLLRMVADRLDLCVRADDIVGRLGGDVFMVLLRGLVDADSAAFVSRRISNLLAAPFRLGGDDLFVTSSIGVSVCPEDGSDLATLMEQASAAMYRGKGQERSHVQFYTADLTRVAAERFRLESSLRLALRREEFVLHFQPQVSVRTGRIVGVEALLRWRHPELGLVPPAEFIPLAEDTGLIQGIGAWAMREACRQVRGWMAEGLPPLRVAVNLSAQEISSAPLTERIAETLAETGLDPDQLEIEITESSVMANFEAAVGALKAVKALGVTLALDDFGTGYSSLSYLRRFPVDRLKLDGSFIRQIADDATDQAIAHAAIELGHGLKLGIVAEGVETPAQLEVLRANGCDAYQGHLFAAPLPAEELGALLRSVSA